ncbi:MAG: GNAT family N-acetyltransferase [Anaerolineales bacterium]
MPLTIRPAIATDIPALINLDHSVQSEYVWQLEVRHEPLQIGIALRQVRLPRPIRVEYPRNIFALADEWHLKSAFWVILDETTPLGYLSLEADLALDLLRITDLVIAPPLRRRGLATRLLRTAQDWASEHRLPRLMWELPAKNHAAISLAQKHLFEFCGYNEAYYPSRDVTLFFYKVIR